MTTSRAASPLLAALVAVLLPFPARSQDEPGPPADLLAHVKVGQVWVFSVPAASARVERRVTEVHADEGRVVYAETSIGSITGTEQRTEENAGQEWTWSPEPPYPATAPLPGYSVGRETLTFGALSLECAFMSLRADDDETKQWTAMKGDVATFPGMVRQVQGQQTLIELLRVETR